MPQIINPLMTQALDAYSTTQSDFAKRASAVSKNSKTAGNPSASPSDYVSILNKRFDLAMKSQAKTNATAALSYCKVTASGQQAIKDAFAEITTLALKNATDSTSSQERLINQQSLASKIDQIAQVNKTVSLNSGQPTTSGAALVIPKPADTTNGACYLANYNTRAFTNVGSIVPGVSTISTGTAPAVATNAVYAITAAAQKDAQNVTFSYYKDGIAQSDVNVDINGTTAVTLSTSEPVGFSTGLLNSTTSSAVQTLDVANNFLKQKAINQSTADTEGDLVSMISVKPGYAPDSRIGATTVQSNKYTNMYAKVKSAVATTTADLYVNDSTATLNGQIVFTGCTSTTAIASASVTTAGNTFFNTEIPSVSVAATLANAVTFAVNGINFTLNPGFTYTTPSAVAGSITVASDANGLGKISCDDANVVVTAITVVGKQGSTAGKTILDTANITYTYVCNTALTIDSGGTTSTTLPNTLTNITVASNQPGSNSAYVSAFTPGAAYTAGSVTGIQYKYTAANSDISTIVPTVGFTTVPTPANLTGKLVNGVVQKNNSSVLGAALTTENVLIKYTKPSVGYGTGGTVANLTSADINFVAAEVVAKGNTKFYVDTGREMLSVTVPNTTTQQTLVLQDKTGANSDVTIDLSSIQNPTISIAETFIQFGGAALKAQFQDSDNPTSSTEIDLTAMTPRALGLDAISILTKEDSVAAMTTLKDIQTDILKIMATTQLGVAKLELSRDQLDINIVATEEVIDATDGINPLEEAQFMASLDQQMQSNVIIISKTISQGRTAQQAFSDLLR